MAQYVDGFVLPIQKKKVAAYRRIAKQASRVWRDHGALDYRECIGEQLECGFGVPFTQLAKARRGETVVFAWIVYKSRAHRDRVTAAVMSDPRMALICNPLKVPFDLTRMACGGFAVLVDGRKR